MKATEKRNEPAYLRLYALVRDDIISGVYPRGARLPSKRTLADKTGTSVITAQHAYELLCDEGYVEARERSGYFVIFRRSDGFFFTGAEDAAAAPEPEQPDAEETAFPFSVYAKAARRTLADYGDAALAKTPGKGSAELRTALSRYLAASRGIKAAPEQIVVGSGSEYLYGLLINLLGRDRIFAIEDPSYEKIEQVYAISGAVFEKLRLGKNGIESAELARSGASVLHISPFRSYPSGVTASASKRHEYLRWAAEKGRIIIEDDFESEFSVSSKPKETLFAMTDAGNVVYMNSFTLTVGSGVRAAYAVLPPDLTAEFDEKAGFYSCTVPTLDQLILARLVASGDFERHVNRIRRARREKRD